MRAGYPAFDLESYPRRPPDAGVLRQRPQQFRRRRELLDALAAWRRRRARSRPSRAPSSRPSRKVTGFVFKVQANMDPNHRDRIAFLRLCSGKFRAA